MRAETKTDRQIDRCQLRQDIYSPLLNLYNEPDVCCDQQTETAYPCYRPRPRPPCSLALQPKGKVGTSCIVHISDPSRVYDNDCMVATGHALYSEVKPRAKPISLAPPAKPGYSPAASANQALGEGSSDNNKACELVAGFKCRVKKPRGPREPPADWSRLER